MLPYNRYNDGLDKWRLTAREVRDEFAKKGADVVYAFQTRNPTHAGHAYLMRTAGEKLLAQVKKTVLLLLALVVQYWLKFLLLTSMYVVQDAYLQYAYACEAVNYRHSALCDPIKLEISMQSH
jgi:ATP-sulfurylase